MNFSELLHKIELSVTTKNPFVVYRKPLEKDVNAIFQKDDFLYKTSDFKQKGFVFAPFVAENDTILLPFEKSDVYKVDQNSEEYLYNQSKFNQSKSEKENYLKLIRKTIDFISSDNAKKIVLSRKEEIELDGFLVSEVFQKLLLSYTSAMVYVWFHPKIGLWMGATPETLLKVTDKKFKTMALAGTQPFTNNLNVNWQRKEIEEQQYVTDYIASKLQGKVAQLTISEPYTVKAGSLVHLRTDINGEIEEDSSLTLLIKVLHPTPAVCGLPKEISQQFIIENENYDREFYTGFLGELNLDSTSILFVNLRCMKVENNKATLFIGGGVTKDSIAENEWQETVIKSAVMKKVL